MTNRLKIKLAALTFVSAVTVGCGSVSSPSDIAETIVEPSDLQPRACVGEGLPADSPFCATTTCPADACAAARVACGTDQALAIVQNTVQLGEIASGLNGCFNIWGIAANGPEIAMLIAKLRNGTATSSDFASFLGENLCDGLGCLQQIPGLGQIGAGAFLTMGLACKCYRQAKGALNCSIGNSECGIQQNQQPLPGPTGICGNSTVMSCVNVNGTTRATTISEIVLQCENMARAVPYSGTNFDTCVTNCMLATVMVQEETTCGAPPVATVPEQPF